jgi:peptide methionine sulfoxide reductase MsrB
LKHDGKEKVVVRAVIFMPKFLDKCEWQNRFDPDNKGGLVWYMDRSKTNKSTGAVVYRCGSRRGHSFSLGLHTTVFQAKIYKYAIKVCIMDNTEKGYIGRNTYVLSTVRQPSRPLTASR